MTYNVEVLQGRPDRQAIILPGRGYTVDMPLLWYASAALSFRQWTCHRISWDEDTGFDQVPDIAEELITAIRDDHPETELIIVGKSLGSLAMPAAVEHQLPGVWLTPVMTEPRIAELCAGLGHDHLLIGGTADQMWDGEIADRSGAQVLQVSDADHSLQVLGDLDRTLDSITTVSRRIDRFVADL